MKERSGFVDSQKRDLISNMNAELTKFWNDNFKNCVPEVHTLKHAFKDRWVRFHALSESKRYPDCEQDYEEIFFRHNTVLSEVNNANSELYIILPEYAESETPSKPEDEISRLFPESIFWCSIDKLEECGVYWHLHAAKINFSGSEMNGLFRKVADSEVGNIMIFGLETKSVFHPYDGGADVFLSSTEKRDILKNAHINYLSKHPDGY